MKIQRRLHSITVLIEYTDGGVDKDAIGALAAQLVPWDSRAVKEHDPVPLSLSSARLADGGRWLFEFEDSRATMLRPGLWYAVVLNDPRNSGKFRWLVDDGSEFVAMGDDTVQNVGVLASNFSWFNMGNTQTTGLFTVRTFPDWASSDCQRPCTTSVDWGRTLGSSIVTAPDDRTSLGFSRRDSLVAQEWTPDAKLEIASFTVNIDVALTGYPSHDQFIVATVYEQPSGRNFEVSLDLPVATFHHQVDVPTNFGSVWRFDYPTNGKDVAWLASRDTRYVIVFSLGRQSDDGKQWDNTFTFPRHQEENSANLGPSWVYDGDEKKWSQFEQGLALQLVPVCRDDKLPADISPVPVCKPEEGPSQLPSNSVRVSNPSNVTDIYLPIVLDQAKRLYAARVLLKPTQLQTVSAELYEGTPADGDYKLVCTLTPDARASNGTTIVSLVADDPKPVLRAGVTYALRLWSATDQASFLNWFLVTGPDGGWNDSVFGVAAHWSEPSTPVWTGDGEHTQRLAVALDYVPSTFTELADYGPCLFGCAPKPDLLDVAAGGTSLLKSSGLVGGQLVVVERHLQLAALTIRVLIPKHDNDLVNNSLQEVRITRAVVADDGATYVPGAKLATLTEDVYGRVIEDQSVDITYRVPHTSSIVLLPNVPYMVSIVPTNVSSNFRWLMRSSQAGSLGYAVTKGADDSWNDAEDVSTREKSVFALNLYAACNLPWTRATVELPADTTNGYASTTASQSSSTAAPESTTQASSAAVASTTAATSTEPATTTTVEVTGASVTLTLDGDCANFDASHFEENVAKLLGVSQTRVHVQDTRCGSIIVDLFLANLPSASEDDVPASTLLQTLKSHAESGMLETATGYPVLSVDNAKEEDVQEVTIPSALVAGEQDNTTADGDGLGTPTIVLLIITSLFMVVAFGLAVRYAMRREQATKAAAETDASTYTGVAGARSNTSEVGTPMNTASSFGTGTLGGQGKAINVDAESTSLDSKYIIDAADLHKGAKIGEGGYGYVYRGEWRGTTVAVKEVRGEERSVVDMLMLEARAAVDLRPHANIVTLYGVCLQPFSIVTAFCEKGSLDDMLYGKKPVEFTEAEEKQLCIGIASGVSHLHLEGMIHRDLAARNILVNANGVPMVADFGMSRRDEGGEQTANQTKTTVGPIRWMAPEQMEHQEYSVYSDVWSYGVILYEIFARQLPWKGLSNMKAGQAVMAGKHLAQDKYVPPDANACVRNVMTACFALEPTHRPRAAWCTQTLTKHYDAPDGGPAFVPKTGGKTMRRTRPEPSGDVYAAPPSRSKDRKSTAKRRGSRTASIRRSDDGTYAPPTRASDLDPYSAPPV